MYTDGNVTIRPMKEQDLHRIWELEFKEEKPEWKKWNAPYFPYQAKTYEEFLPTGQTWVNSDDAWVIEVDGIVCGMVSYYWEHEPSKWLEMGICLHHATTWGKGIGTRVMKLWIDHLFNTMPLVRVGFTTWSGNERMIAVGEKLGMQLEARIRKVRYYEGHYYDSIRMGLLREEWAQNKKGSGSMGIRLLTAADAKAYWALRVEALQSNPDSFLKTYKEELQLDDPIKHYANLLQHENRYTYGVYMDEQLVAVGTLQLETALKVKHKANILAMYVSQYHRRLKIGKKLMLHLIEQAKSLGIEQLQLSVVANNISAKNLYQSLGFCRYGLEQKALRLNGQYWDEEHMVLFLT